MYAIVYVLVLFSVSICITALFFLFASSSLTLEYALALRPRVYQIGPIKNRSMNDKHLNKPCPIQASKSAMISGEDLEEIWERAITVARTEFPNRWGLSLTALCGQQFNPLPTHFFQGVLRV